MSDQKSTINHLESSIKRIGVIGAGTMGSGIAQVAATAGCTVKLYDSNSMILVESEKKLEKI